MAASRVGVASAKLFTGRAPSGSYGLRARPDEQLRISYIGSLDPDMNPLLEAIAQGWSWMLGEPVAIVATNCFGNAIVQNKDGHFFRITPEEWQCKLLAQSSSELEEMRRGEDFIRDWEMAALAERAESALGSLVEGEVYCLVIPGCLGGRYAEENIRKITLRELLAYSGDMARQIDDVPDGASVTIKVTE